MDEEINYGNWCGVGRNGFGYITMMATPSKALTRDEALVLAAWLVVLADPGDNRFQVILDRVRNT